MSVGTAALSDRAQLPEQDYAQRPQWRHVAERIIGFLSSKNLEPTEREERDIAVIPGHAINSTLIERERKVGALRNLIYRFAHNGFPWPTGGSIVIPMDTAMAANRLMDLLSEQMPLPKVGPEEGGGLVLAWELDTGTHLLILDGWRYHMVENAGTLQAKYIDDQEFQYSTLPEPLRQVLGNLE